MLDISSYVVGIFLDLLLNAFINRLFYENFRFFFLYVHLVKCSAQHFMQMIFLHTNYK